MIRKLGHGDAAIYRAIRREALLTDPEAFASNVAYLDSQSDDDLNARLEMTPTFVSFEGERPIGLMAYFRGNGAVERHRANLINVFVSPAQRGRGIAADLLSHIVEHAKDAGVIQIELMVAAGNASAISSYERSGFSIVGTIPNGMRHGDTFIDEHIMVKPIAS